MLRVDGIELNTLRCTSIDGTLLRLEEEGGEDWRRGCFIWVSGCLVVLKREVEKEGGGQEYDSIFGREGADTVEGRVRDVEFSVWK